MNLSGKPEPDQDPQLRFQRFQDLMRFRVRDILLASSLYDSFILAEDGSLYESLLNEYLGLGLTHMPNIHRVSSGAEALRLAREPGRFDIVICSLRLSDIHATDLARRLKEIGVDTPVVMLTYDNRELNELIERGGAKLFDKVFIWQGDFRVFLAIIKHAEDLMNVEHDTELVGVQSIILVEDSVKFYSSYLPLIYTAVLGHTAELISEGVNPAHRLLRMRARPKIILCDTYEEAWRYFERYHETTLGVISDIEFPRGGKMDPKAGFALAREVKQFHRDIPVLLQSRGVEARTEAEALGASFLQKDSPVLLLELKRFMAQHFGFGDFVFRLRDGTVVDRAGDLRTLEEKLYSVPDESIAHHGERNHFSVWLKARTEFLLAHRLRPVEVSDYKTIADVREHLINSLREHRREQQRGSIVDFDPDTFDVGRSYARVGGGSLGGKARGLAFANTLIDMHGLEDSIPGARILVPPSIILGTDVFDRFLEDNDLWDFALRTQDDAAILERFLQADFPEMVREALSSFLQTVRSPLSVRSSSLLEDSQFMPFAGVYETHMIPNDHRDPNVRLAQLVASIERVYASTFYRAAKMYIKSTPYRVEEEKMAVILQPLVGSAHGSRFYPDISGVARSHNYYPIAPMKAEDGIASVALGLGKQVVEGGAAVRFCPRYPRHIVQFSNVADVLKYSQKTFYALESSGDDDDGEKWPELGNLELDVAERDGTLAAVGSTYSRENHAIYDGVSRPGVRVVTLAPILKNDLYPLPQILIRLLEIGRKGMSGPVEIEFAANLSGPAQRPKEFYLLQMRPMVVEQELERLSILDTAIEDVICRSYAVLGNGMISDIHDIVVVDIERFDRAQSIQVAREVGLFNVELLENQAPYVLIGVGRWGSADPWLGIPVRWEEISGARVIVETGMKDVKVTPSQGTHFFQNITASKVGYITVTGDGGSFVDWEWLAAQPAVRERRFARHLHFDEPVGVIMDGHHNKAIILKPRAEAR
jgi:CheY-like chemotaxis protein